MRGDKRLNELNAALLLYKILVCIVDLIDG